MAFKDLETKRSLRKKYRDSKDQLKYTQKSLASTEQERDIANSRLEKTKANLNKVPALYVAETPESEAFNFECMGVENANDYKVV